MTYPEGYKEAMKALAATFYTLLSVTKSVEFMLNSKTYEDICEQLKERSTELKRFVSYERHFSEIESDESAAEETRIDFLKVYHEKLFQ